LSSLIVKSKYFIPTLSSAWILDAKCLTQGS
jgi:hypothetical protein